MTPPAARPCSPGLPWPMGATLALWQGQSGVNLAVFSRHASAVYWCLFDEASGAETDRLALTRSAHGIWHGFAPGLQAGQLYGLRADGPWQPEAGHRFNPARLLIDPWARELVGDVSRLSLETEHRSPEAAGADQPDAKDNAARMPKARVVDLAAELAAGAALAPGPRIEAAQCVLYEAHVKGLTQRRQQLAPEQRGTYAGVASDAMLAHYRRLGVTTVCLLPVQQHIDEIHLVKLGLSNYWGYNTLGFFIPEPAYAAAREAGGQAVRDEFRAMVQRLHEHGFELVLDVVYNHTPEGDTRGPTLSWRGLDHASAYALGAQGQCLNFTGCGNAVNVGEPQMVRWVMDSLRWWVQAFGVDGFRFDLAATLGRDPALQHRFHPAAALFTAMAQDPTLSRVKLIAEPWDIAMGGYQVGAFPPGWHEWNDAFRDTVRAYWLGHECTPGQLARRITGSNDLFHHHGRSPLASVNLITAHDGFTLADVTAYRSRHNLANGEDNRDGHGHNLSANGGVEGPTQDAAIVQLRAGWRRALLATLLLAQGTPQLLAGDEIGHSQRGNNNAYCQDNEISWLDWSQADEDLTALVSRLTALRRRYPAFRHPRWFEGHPFHEPGHPYVPGGDIAWLRPDGLAMSDQDWDNPWERSFAYVIEVGEGDAAATERVMVIHHPSGGPTPFQLPPGAWRLLLDTAVADTPEARTLHERIEVRSPAVCVLAQAVKPAGAASTGAHA
ncbi:MAG TPA: glycogen debranching protein GlgX [Ramlibacter sp.]|nr:glycogen debranching protein GlgX [Ramlibacter sp.]